MKLSSEVTGEMLVEARECFLRGNYKVAEPLLQQMVLQGSRNPEVFQMLATIFYDKGSFNKAIKTFQRALEIDPGYTDASVGLSIILNDLGRYDEGKKIFQEAKDLLQRKSQNQDPWINEKLAGKHEELANLYLQYDRVGEALEQLVKAGQLSGRKAEIRMKTADCLAKLGEADKAVRELRSLLREYPNLNAARMKLGNVLLSLGQVAEATEQWENILARDPANSEAAKALRMAQSASVTLLSGSP